MGCRFLFRRLEFSKVTPPTTVVCLTPSRPVEFSSGFSTWTRLRNAACLFMEDYRMDTVFGFSPDLSIWIVEILEKSSGDMVDALGLNLFKFHNLA